MKFAYFVHSYYGQKKIKSIKNWFNIYSKAVKTSGQWTIIFGRLGDFSSLGLKRKVLGNKYVVLM